MELLRGLHDLQRRTARDAVRCAVAIGNFDGVHLGHQALVQRASELAAASGTRSTVLTFEPHPREYFAPADAPPRLMRLREKHDALAALGVERLCVVRFDEALRCMHAPEFVAEVLVRGLGARHVVIGEGFRFAAGREAGVDALREAGVAHGFDVHVVPSVTVDGARVSSTRVRASLAGGDLELAKRLLGRHYRMSGRVIRGQQLGRTLGYATANMRLHRRKLPLSGIFAVRVAGADGGCAGVASLGTRPTVHGVEPLLETHVFDFAGDLYGRRLDVDFVAKLRDETKFDSLDALVAQMHLDARQAREILAARAA